MGDTKKAVRKRATGTRERVVTYLAESGPLHDKDGMASTRLAAAVDYPGSSVAFAQLLSGMERSGLVKREVRGKRTYSISLGDVDRISPAARGRIVEPATAGAGMLGGGSPGSQDFDYDELARRLLIQVVRRLAAAEPELDLRQPPGAPTNAGPLGGTVSDLEHELASAWTKHGRLAEENIRLREQLRSAQQSLDMARERVRRLPITSDLDNAEVVLLQRLLSPEGEESDGRAAV
ncbi:MAG TPA: hypothetical protein VF070_11705 [Streptosporangiaceae bacterium]